MNKTCKQSGSQFCISDAEKIFYQKMNVSTPTLCPERRQQRKLAWRNENCLYSRSCDHCGKGLIGLYDPENPHKVYCPECWWSDCWDSKENGMNFDFSKSFFEQFHTLLLQVPRLSVYQTKSQNADYTNFSSENKSCYLITASGFNEDCQYADRLFHCKDCVDCFNLEHCQLAYFSATCNNCYNIDYCEYSNNLNDCAFCYDCRSCNNCFGCFGLRNKQYCFFNRQLTKDTYKEELQKIQLRKYSSIQAIYKHSREHFLRYPHRYAWIFQSEDVTGDIVDNSKGSANIFFSKEIEHSHHLYGGYQSKFCHDCIPADGSELCYESMSLWHNYNVRFTLSSWEASNLTYCDLCFSSSDLFGCVGVRNGKFMILNKQYTEQDYYDTSAKIIEHMQKCEEWGEFFPASISPHAYNETAAQDFLPLSQEQAQTQNYRWSKHTGGTHGKETVSADSIPDSIENIGNGITSHVLSCTGCSKNFKINKKELEFYKNKNIPLPRKCPECRRKQRLSLRNPLKLWWRQCMHEWEQEGQKLRCQHKFHTPYAVERKETIYCDKCYSGLFN